MIMEVFLIILCLVIHALVYMYVVIPLDTVIFVAESSSSKRAWLMISTRIMWVLTTFKIIDIIDTVYKRFTM